MDLQTQMRLQNMFGAPDFTVGNALPDSGPTALSAPPIVQPMDTGQDPYKNISFGDTNFKPAVAPPPQSPDDTDMGFDAGARMKELYSPHTQAIDKFNQLINQYPNRADYKPSMLRKIAAGLASFGRGGPAMSAQIMTAPWDAALADWQNKIKPTAEAANMERFQNTNERTMAYQTVANELKQRSQDLKEKNDATNAQIKEHRAAVYEFKAMHPGMKLVFTKGGNVQAMDPITGKLMDTGVPTGSMTELDKLNLQEQNTLTNIDAKETAGEKLEGVKQTGRLQSIAARTEGTLRAVRERNARTGAGSKPETPTQTRVRQFNAARELYNTRPELRGFIKLGRPGSNDFVVTPPNPSAFFSSNRGPSAQQYKEIQDKVYGASKAGATQFAPATSHTPTESPTIPAGRVAIFKDGKAVGTVPKEQAEEAKKQGYTIGQ